MTHPDAEERATEPRSLQVFDRVLRLIGLRDLIEEKFADGAGETSNEVTSRDIVRRRLHIP